MGRLRIKEKRLVVVFILWQEHCLLKYLSDLIHLTVFAIKQVIDSLHLREELRYANENWGLHRSQQTN